MKEWFGNLELREQQFVAAGAIVVALVLVWALLWLPFDRGHTNLQRSVADWQQSLSDLKAIAANQAAGDQGGSQPARVQSDQSPLVIVDQTLREASLNSAVKRRQPTPNGIRVEFENVAFDQLIVWIGALNSDYGMVVQAGSFSLANRAGPGRINASVTLERAP
tara:strand:+ start:4717 stop:5208 length:492 start_codon:yes stop_codon:yes gene_type:complete